MVLAPVMLLAVFAMPRSAAACTCWSEPLLMFPTPDGEYHPAHPLWAYSLDNDSFELVHESGGTIALEAVTATPVWGGCSSTVYQLRPTAQLEPGARYELSSAWGETEWGKNTWGETDTKRTSFVVGDVDTTYKAISRIDMTAAVEELPPDQVGPALCGDAKLQGRPITATLVIEVRTPPDAPVILTGTVEDAVSGTHESVDVSLADPFGRDLARINFTLPAEASRCADVSVLDLDGVKVFGETLCPNGSAPLTRSFEAEILALPVTATAVTPRDLAPSRGCIVARPSRSSPSAFDLLAGAVLALRCTCRRRGSASEVAARRSVD
jgi:hypothetical protein